MWSALCSSALESKRKNKTTKNNKQMEVHDWLKYRVVCVFFLVFWVGFQGRKTKLQTTLKKSIVFNDFANEEYMYTYIHTYIHTGIQTYRHTDIQTYRHTDIQTYMWFGLRKGYLLDPKRIGNLWKLPEPGSILPQSSWLPKPKVQARLSNLLDDWETLSSSLPIK